MTHPTIVPDPAALLRFKKQQQQQSKKAEESEDGQLKRAERMLQERRAALRVAAVTQLKLAAAKKAVRLNDQFVGR